VLLDPGEMKPRKGATNAMAKQSFIFSSIYLYNIYSLMIVVDVVIVVVVAQSSDDIITMKVTQYPVDCTASLNHPERIISNS
jgi:hypothetical protein